MNVYNYQGRNALQSIKNNSYRCGEGGKGGEEATGIFFQIYFPTGFIN